jgi:hypothetical protein
MIIDRHTVFLVVVGDKTTLCRSIPPKLSDHKTRTVDLKCIEKIFRRDFNPRIEDPHGRRSNKTLDHRTYSSLYLCSNKASYVPNKEFSIASRFFVGWAGQ